MSAGGCPVSRGMSPDRDPRSRCGMRLGVPPAHAARGARQRHERGAGVAPKQAENGFSVLRQDGASWSGAGRGLSVGVAPDEAQAKTGGTRPRRGGRGQDGGGGEAEVRTRGHAPVSQPQHTHTHARFGASTRQVQKVPHPARSCVVPSRRLPLMKDTLQAALTGAYKLPLQASSPYKLSTQAATRASTVYVGT